jgi:hypothetical protein
MRAGEAANGSDASGDGCEVVKMAEVVRCAVRMRPLNCLFTFH